MQTKAILFDCFGVVVAPLLGTWVPKNLGTEFNEKKIFAKIDIGEISEHEALLYFSKLVNRPSEIVRQEIDSCFVPNTELIEFMKELRSKNFKIILLSNASNDFFERFVYTKHPWFRELFDDIVVSSLIKMVKPNSDIFLYTLNKNNLKPEDAVFIDDSQTNVEGAQKVGVPSILFKNTEQLKLDLQKLGILPT